MGSAREKRRAWYSRTSTTPSRHFPLPEPPTTKPPSPSSPLPPFSISHSCPSSCLRAFPLRTIIPPSLSSPRPARPREHAPTNTLHSTLPRAGGHFARFSRLVLVTYPDRASPPVSYICRWDPGRVFVLAFRLREIFPHFLFSLARTFCSLALSLLIVGFYFLPVVQEPLSGLRTQLDAQQVVRSDVSVGCRFLSIATERPGHRRLRGVYQRTSYLLPAYSIISSLSATPLSYLFLSSFYPIISPIRIFSKPAPGGLAPTSRHDRRPRDDGPAVILRRMQFRCRAGGRVAMQGSESGVRICISIQVPFSCPLTQSPYRWHPSALQCCPVTRHNSSSQTVLLSFHPIFLLSLSTGTFVHSCYLAPCLVSVPMLFPSSNLYSYLH